MRWQFPLQSLNDPLRPKFLRNDISHQAILFQFLSCRRSDCRQFCIAERTRIPASCQQPVEEPLYTIRTRKDQPLIIGQPGNRLVQGLVTIRRCFQPDCRRLDHLGPQLLQPGRKLRCLAAGPRDQNRLAK